MRLCPRGGGALALLALLLSSAALLPSCSARVDAKLGASGSASLKLALSVPPALAERLRSLAGAGGAEGVEADAPFFDAAAVKAALLARRGVASATASRPSPESLSVSIELGDLGAFLADQGLGSLLRLETAAGIHRLSIRLERGKLGPLLALLPALDPALVEALSPPALGTEDYSREEYRQALGTILGAKALPALDAAAVELNLSLPGEVLDSSGGQAQASTWKLSLPLLDLLVLERPIEYRLSWR